VPDTDPETPGCEATLLIKQQRSLYFSLLLALPHFISFYTASNWDVLGSFKLHTHRGEINAKCVCVCVCVCVCNHTMISLSRYKIVLFWWYIWTLVCHFRAIQSHIRVVNFLLFFWNVFTFFFHTVSRVLFKLILNFNYSLSYRLKSVRKKISSFKAKNLFWKLCYV
jgi:hypothetical protein